MMMIKKAFHFVRFTFLALFFPDCAWKEMGRAAQGAKMHDNHYKTHLKEVAADSFRNSVINALSSGVSAIDATEMVSLGFTSVEIDLIAKRTMREMSIESTGKG